MSFGEAVRSGFEHYVDFQGRASRPAFWWWVLFGFIVGIAANIIDAAIFDTMILTWIAAVALFLPGLAVAVRRLHDTDRSGWWVLIDLIPIIGIIVLIVFWVQEGTPGENRFGPPPAETAAPAAA